MNTIVSVRFLALSLFLLNFSCSTSTKDVSETDSRPDSEVPSSNKTANTPQETYQHLPRPNVKGLNHEQAKNRALRVKNVSYDLLIDLHPTKSDFDGEVLIHFTLSHPSDPLTIDFQGGTVHSVVSNEKKAEYEYNGDFITIAPSSLQNGRNHIEISYSHPYSRNGVGLYRFKDPVDQRVYLYTDFEPYNANLLFPCFDQPDIKARYQLEVEAPSKWQIISSSSELKVESKEGGRKHWKFERTRPFSTYLLALHAGPYRVWKSRAGSIPLRLFARKSIAKHVRHWEWMKWTQQGFSYFEEYFQFPYPFKKYDQVLVPDFNSGAMENVGAVTYSERFIKRGKPTSQERERNANVLLHEMAHMWFGNLTTMKWWDDLWLNESFATFMATKALVEATEFKNAWRTFFSGMKLWAYWEDQLVTTHPIATPVGNTRHAFTNFDGITYGKGAAALKQLNFYIGENQFRDGVRQYFKKHAFGNTRLVDFISALEDSSKIRLASWTNEWLKSSGLNTVSVRYRCKNNRISQMILFQKSKEGQRPVRSHKTQIGLYGTYQDGSVRLQSLIPCHL